MGACVRRSFAVLGRFVDVVEMAERFRVFGGVSMKCIDGIQDDELWH